MNEKAISEWLKLTSDTKKNIFSEVSSRTGLPPAAIEKDWWVVRTLEIVFQMDVAGSIVFKGGTSLSKAWGLIDRFSEDIDLALDKKLLGFEEIKNNSQLKRLREKSFEYISTTFFESLSNKFKEINLNVELRKEDNIANDQDPIVIEIHYESYTDAISYLPSKVLIEIGSRSLMEPSTQRNISSFVGEGFIGKPFADQNFAVSTVIPERTFLEKIFLLHENFQLREEKTKIERLSRHLYDIEKIMDTEFGERALKNKELYFHIVEHRKTITPLRGIDYSNHIPSKIKLVPPENKLKEWEKDYRQMQESMIYKDSLSFTDLIKRIEILQERINKLEF